MTKLDLAAGVAAALSVAFAASAALAGEGAYVCQTTNPAKASPSVTRCLTWSHEAAARMQAEGCDPAKMAGDSMREACARLTANGHAREAGRTPAAG
jgi:hypothetical protein